MRVERRFVFAALIIAPVASVFSLFGVQARDVRPAPADPLARPDPRISWTGVGSCASSACHGSLDLKCATPLQSAVTLWTRDDPHGRSYTALKSERSRQMLVSLRQLGRDAAARADQEPLCLKCHAMNPPEELRGPKFDATEGVGCESCHGPAGNWKHVHDLPFWKTLSDGEKASYGMRALRNPAVRADVCAGCHQGSPDNEVNHDLIAAGHPALFLDVSAQSDRLPKHYDPMIDRRDPDFAARLWANGQIVGARLSMELLAARAADDRKPWPEFSEHDCLSCHRNPLLDPLPPVKGGRFGAPAYLGWNQPLTRVLATADKRFHDPKLLTLFDELNAEMNRASPDRGVVAAKARAIKAELDGLAARAQGASFSRDDLSGLLKAVVDQYAPEPAARWYVGAQLTSGLTALSRARTDLDPSAARPEVDAALRKLQATFPPPVDRGWRHEPKTPQPLAPLLDPLR